MYQIDDIEHYSITVMTREFINIDSGRQHGYEIDIANMIVTWLQDDSASNCELNSHRHNVRMTIKECGITTIYLHPRLFLNLVMD